jgi:cytochrome b561
LQAAAVAPPPDSGQGASVRYRNGGHGYGAVTKLLHWLTVAVIVSQFLVGVTMDFDDAGKLEERQFQAEADRLEDAAKAQGKDAEERVKDEIDAREDVLDAEDDDLGSGVLTDVVTGRALGNGLSLPELHVGLGLLVIALAAVRLLWRRGTPLPPWAEHLSPGERRLEGGVEKALLALLLVVPATGLLLVAGGQDWLPVHVAAQVAFLGAIAVHVGLVLSHTVLRPNRHLARML